MITKAIGFRIRPRIEHLILYVTSRCNLNCKTCFVCKEDLDLPIEHIRKIADRFHDVAWLNIGGGEPFLRDDLPYICTLFQTKDLTIPTNGIDTSRIEKLTRTIRTSYNGELTVGVSLDGFEETNDDIRGRDSYANAVETVRLLTKKDRINVKVSTVISARNFPELILFMKFVQSLGVQYHSLLLLRGKPKDPRYRLPPVEDLQAARDDIFSILKRYPYGSKRWSTGLARNYHRLLWNYSMKALKDKQMPIPCLAGRAHLVIHPNGDVAPCELLPSVGNLSEKPIEDICSGVKMNAAIRRICQDTCYCTHNCNMVENILFNWKTYPKLMGFMNHV